MSGAEMQREKEKVAKMMREKQALGRLIQLSHPPRELHANNSV